MNHLRFVTVGFALLISLIGCSRKSSHQADESMPIIHSEAPAPSAPSTSQLQRWKLRFSSKCQKIRPEKCPGFYGLSISSDGVYQVGPGPEGQTIDGKLDELELKTLSDVFPPETLQAPQPFSCDTSPETQITNSIQVGSDRPENEILRSNDSNLCSSAAVGAVAASLLGSMRILLEKYYPTEFPNHCINAANSLRTFHFSLRDCMQDADCAYIDDGYLPFEPSFRGSIVADDCSVIQTLIVANHFQAVSNQLKLLMMREVTRRVCGALLIRSSCTQPTTLLVDGRSPVCIENKCQPAPNLTTQ